MCTWNHAFGVTILSKHCLWLSNEELQYPQPKVFSETLRILGRPQTQQNCKRCNIVLNTALKIL